MEQHYPIMDKLGGHGGQTYRQKPPPKHNYPVILLSKFIDAVISPTQESKTFGGCINAKDSLPIRHTEKEIGHPQGPTPLQF